ncbi:MAG TPA: sortase [Anaerolineaceae bacterium]|nr:sortase [Anaerolineaceae bacterium]
MIKKRSSHNGILYIALGLILLAVSIPGYFSSADTGVAPAQPPLYAEPREVITSVVNVPPSRAIALKVEEMPQGVEEAASEQLPIPPIYLDVTAAYIRSTDASLENPPVPDRIEIPAIQLDAPVIAADHRYTEVEGATFGQWLAPSFFAAGWHPDSALPGEVGNTVINGHHNIDGEVFADLVNVMEGDTILLRAGERSFEYVVTNRMILPETFMDAATRLDNARWLGRSDDERLTLVTCWPKESYTHRLILVAVPVN